MFVIALALTVTVILIAGEVRQYISENRANLSLAESVRTQRETTAQTWRASGEASSQETDAEQGTILPWYEALYNSNNDMAGWLYIDGTNIDYPVMYTPRQQDYYLHLAFNGDYAASGSLFIAVPWESDGRHTIIYGHHMRDGSMFGQLSRYADASYGREHAVIHFDTLTQEGEYELVAAFYSQVYDEADGDWAFRYYDYPALSTEEEFAYYVRQVRAAALYDTGIEPVWGDTLLTLSTCNYHTEDGRFVVVARKITQEG